MVEEIKQHTKYLKHFGHVLQYIFFPREFLSPPLMKWLLHVSGRFSLSKVLRYIAHSLFFLTLKFLCVLLPELAKGSNVQLKDWQPAAGTTNRISCQVH